MKRKKKYVVWLYNHTSHKDDEWVVVWANSPEEAMRNLDSDKCPSNFTKGIAYTVKQFRACYPGYPV